MKDFCRWAALAAAALLAVVPAGPAAAGGPDGLGGPRVGMPNPAALYCEQLGYRRLVIEDSSGQTGLCVMPDGSACEEWSFLEGQCGEEFSLCARRGLELEVSEDGLNPFSRRYAVCVETSDSGRSAVGSVTSLAGLETGYPSYRRGEAGHPPATAAAPREPGRLAAPAAFDWRDQGGFDWTTPVKNQGGCGSCWAFSAVGTVEAALNIAASSPDLDPDLSEQYLVAGCSATGDCCGGWHDYAIDYIRDQGVPDEACLPYVDGGGCSCGGGTCDANCAFECSDRQCSDRCADWASRLSTVSSSGWVSGAEAMKEQLSTVGPLGVAMGIGDATVDGQNIWRCSDDNSVDHAVVIVGYDDTGGYWIVRNSWGATWNGDGHFKVGYGECAIEDWAYGVTATAVAADAYEPDNESAEAAAIAAGETQQHSLYPAGDVDWVTFELGGEATVLAQTQGLAGDTRLYLYDGALSLVAFDDDGGAGLFSRVELSLPAGRYYIMVDEYWGNVLPEYSLSLEAQPISGDAYEPDGQPEWASFILPGESQARSLYPAGDVDWIGVQLEAPGRLQAETSGAAGDTYMALYDEQLNPLAYDDGSGEGEFAMVTSPLLPAGVYFLQVWESAGAELPAYTLQVRMLHALRGRVLSSALLPLGGVRMNLLRDGVKVGSTLTRANGRYALWVEDGSYTVRPRLAGRAFTPARRRVTVSGADVRRLNFTSTP